MAEDQEQFKSATITKVAEHEYKVEINGKTLRTTSPEKAVLDVITKLSDCGEGPLNDEDGKLVQQGVAQKLHEILKC